MNIIHLIKAVLYMQKILNVCSLFIVLTTIPALAMDNYLIKAESPLSSFMIRQQKKIKDAHLRALKNLQAICTKKALDRTLNVDLNKNRSLARARTLDIMTRKIAEQRVLKKRLREELKKLNKQQRTAKQQLASKRSKVKLHMNTRGMLKGYNIEEEKIKKELAAVNSQIKLLRKKILELKKS